MNQGEGWEEGERVSGQWVVGQTFQECFLYNTPLNWFGGGRRRSESQDETRDRANPPWEYHPASRQAVIHCMLLQCVCSHGGSKSLHVRCNDSMREWRRRIFTFLPLVISSNFNFTGLFNEDKSLVIIIWSKMSTHLRCDTDLTDKTISFNSTARWWNHCSNGAGPTFSGLHQKLSLHDLFPAYLRPLMVKRRHRLACNSQRQLVEFWW